MMDEVDQLKAAIGVETDTALAAELGLERSSISQWRRRGAVPLRYRALLDSNEQGEKVELRRATRRLLYGDGSGRYILSAALAVIPDDAFSFPTTLSPANVGWSRETLIANVVEAVSTVALSVFGRTRCETDGEFIVLVTALQEPAGQALVEAALRRPIVGEY